MEAWWDIPGQSDRINTLSGMQPFNYRMQW